MRCHAQCLTRFIQKVNIWYTKDRDRTITICSFVYAYGTSTKETVFFFHSRARDKKPIPGSHSGKYFRTGKISTRKAPGRNDRLKLTLVRSMRVTSSSCPSLTSYP